jgi:carbon monoxide dehydrogenase subunit G
MPTTVTGRASIPLPLEVCWEKLRDLTRAVNYVPGLTGCVVTTELREGVGASRRVTSKRFGDMDETVVIWDEGKGFTIRLHKGDGPATPFQDATFRYALEPTDGGCEIVTSMTYQLGFGPLGALLDALILRRVSRSNVRKVALALAEHYVTDAPVPPQRLAELLRQAR